MGREVASSFIFGPTAIQVLVKFVHPVLFAKVCILVVCQLLCIPLLEGEIFVNTSF